MSQEEMKKKAALKALENLRPGMKLGLGTGSTARYFVDGLGALVRDGLEVVCVPTSETTRQQAESLNIPLADLGTLKRLDLTIDGADEIDPALNLIKGGGGALLREKIVAAASDAMMVIADETKWVSQLGAFPLPVEINHFAHEASAQALGAVLQATGHQGDIQLRQNAAGEVFKTDSGHVIYDCALGAIHDPQNLAAALLDIPGVMEHGLFIKMARKVYLASADGVKECE